MKKEDLINCIIKLDGSGPLRRKILSGYSEEKLRKLLRRKAKLDMELIELQCVSMLS